MESRNAMEKLIKCIPVFMILIFGFVMRCELFHITLGNAVFASYPASYCNIKESEFTSFIKSVEQDAEVSNVSCFFTSWENESRLEQRLTIYTNEEAVKSAFNYRNNICEGVYESLLSGTTKIVFLPLEECPYDTFMLEPYLGMIGTDEARDLLYKVLQAKYEISYPQIMQLEETDMVMIVWLMVAIFIILINGSMVLRKKKEMLIRTIYGEDIVKITIRSMLEDFIIYELLYFLAKWFVSMFISGDYKQEVAFFIFQVGCLVAVSFNLLYLKADVRAVFSNVTDNKRSLTLLYVLKSVAFAIAVFTLTTNFSSLERVAFSKGSDKLYSLYKEGMFLSISDKEWNVENGSERVNLEDMIWKQLYSEFYATIRPVVSINLTGGNNPFILINEFASPLLLEELDIKKVADEDIMVIYPNDLSVLKEDIEGLLGLYLDNSQNIKWKTVEYETHISVPYVSTNQLTGFSEAVDPIIVYCKENVRLNSFVFANNQDVIYDITADTLQILDNELGVTEQGFHFVSTNMGELYQYQMNFVTRLVQFLSSLCILVLLLDFAIMITLCTMEYRIFGMEYAIKKVFGYSFMEKNKRQFLRSNVGNVIAVILFIVFGVFTKIYEPFTCLFVGGVVIVVENIVMVSCIFKMESTSVRKVLKGGCL